MESTPFGIALRRHRLAAGLSQEALAEQAGISVRSIIGLESEGNHQPRPATIHLIADALKLTEQEKVAWLALRAAPVAKNHDELADNLFGRAADCTAVQALLTRQDTPLLTICGLGGIGKTSLAHAVAARHAPTLRDGMGWVGLDALRDPADVPQAVLSSLKLTGSPKKAPLAVLRAALRKREMVIVLDNFEHLLPAANYLVELLGDCPGVTWLITSRTSLRLRAEQVYMLGLLELPPVGVEDTDQIAASPAVAMFVARNQRHNPSFRLHDANAQAVAGICRALDGIPLALELAATRANLFTPKDLLSHLHARLDFLTRGPRDLPDRQQTLRATLAWSYQLLAAPEQRIFRQLAVFAGGIPIDAVASVSACSAAEAIDGLATLTEHSLVQRVAAAAPRVAMLETVREYASEQIAAHDELAATQRRHALYYLAWAEVAEPQTRGPEQHVWLNQLEEELPNLRLALDWSLRHAEVEVGIRIVTAAWRMWYQRGYLVEGRQWVGTLLNHPAVAQVDLRWRANATSVAGWLAFGQGDYAAAATHHEACLALRRTSQNTSGIASTLNNLGGVARMLGDLTRADRLFTEALDIFRELDDIDSMGEVMHNLAAAAWGQGKADEARQWCEASLALAQQSGQIDLVASCHEGFGILAYDQGDYATALAQFTEYERMAREIGGGRALGMANQQLGLVYLACGSMAAAQEAFQRCLDLGTERADEAGCADAHLGLGWVALLVNDDHAARQHLTASLTSYTRLESRSEMAATLDAIAYGAVFTANHPQPHLAARLLEAADALRTEWNITLPPQDAARVRQVQAYVDTYVTRAQRDDEPLWNVAEATAAAHHFLALLPVSRCPVVGPLGVAPPLTPPHAAHGEGN